MDYRNTFIGMTFLKLKWTCVFITSCDLLHHFNMSSQLSYFASGKHHDHFYEDLNNGGPNGPSFARGYQGAFQPGKTLRHSYPAQRPLNAGTFGARAGPASYWGPSGAEAVLAKAKPKVITVVRSGAKPHGTVKILLNRRSVQSFKQLMKDIAEAFGAKSKSNRVRRLYNVRGREVMGVSDFFRDDDVFIGVGAEAITTSGVQDILEELYPNSPYAKNLLRDWERAWKRQLRQRARAADKDDGNDSKIDSGLGSDSSHRDDVDDPRGRHKVSLVLSCLVQILANTPKELNCQG